MAKEQEERERRWQEIQRHAEGVRQVHPARRLPSESDMLWLVEEVRRLHAENARRAGEGEQAADALANAA